MPVEVGFFRASAGLCTAFVTDTFTRRLRQKSNYLFISSVGPHLHRARGHLLHLLTSGSVTLYPFRHDAEGCL
jgi:hypothetical protein